MPDLPPALAAALRPVLPELARDTVAAIGREVPDYARPLEGPFGQALQAGVQVALERFVDELSGPAPTAGAPSQAMYVSLGRGELRAGRSLDALLSAYRLGARLAWERFQAAAVAAGHPPEVLYALAGAIFTYIDAISAESVAGYADEQSRAAGERARRRRALARVLGTDGLDPGELTTLAGAAGWPLPARVAALAVAGDEDPERLASRLGTDVIAAVDPDDTVTVAWVPDPEAPGRRAQLGAALRDAPAALGPAAEPAGGPRSLRRARAALATLQAGRLAGTAGKLVIADEHLLELLLHGAGRQEAGDLADRLLAPLDALPAGARARATLTLRAWLDHPGQVQRVGAVLHVHPQTVRYRLAKLRELFGEQLEDPDARFALALALRARG